MTPDAPHGNLPAVPETAAEEKIYDLKVVDETAAAAVPGAVAVPAVRAVLAHPVARVAGRHGLYVAAGAIVAWRRWRSRKTLTARMAMAAAASGDHEGALKWAQLDAQQRRERHERVVEKIETAGKTFILLPKMAVGLGVALVVLGLLIAGATRRADSFFAPALLLAHLAEFAFAVVSAVWMIVSIGFPVAILAALYLLGRTAGDLAPGWAVTSADPDIDVSIDEMTLTGALKNMRIPQIRDYLKQDLPLQFITPCRIDGRGTFAAIRLPGVPAEKIARRRADLAAGLYRLPTEVWPKMGSEAAILEVWIADKGALAEGAGPYPLLGEGFTDVFKGFPFGKSLRGDPVRIPFMGRNTLCGGMPEQGKSNGARVMAAGCTLDIIVELRLYIPDTNFDFERFRPRCARYVMGAEDEFIERIAGDMEELKEELQMRGQLLIDAEAEEVTYPLAHAGIGLHPVFVLLEEAHVAIQHRKYGKDISQLLCDIVKLDRKRGVHLMLSTQAPTKDSMPRDVTRNCANGIAFAVGDHVANDALLGQGAYRAGHRATELIPGEDRGTALCKGFSGERSEMVQLHRIQGRADNDQVTPLVKRALAEMERKGRALPGSGRPLAITARDLLGDLAEVLGGSADKVRLADLPALLANYAKQWGPYKTLTGVQLRAQLEERGVRTTNPKNVPTLDPADLHEVIARRGELGEAIAVHRNRAPNWIPAGRPNLACRPNP